MANVYYTVVLIRTSRQRCVGSQQQQQQQQQHTFVRTCTYRQIGGAYRMDPPGKGRRTSFKRHEIGGEVAFKWMLPFHGGDRRMHLIKVLSCHIDGV